MWITGGIVDRITINPLSWSYTYYGSLPKYPQFTTWAGVLFGSAMGLILLCSVWKKETPYLVPFLFMGLAPLLNGGGYYLVDTFISTQGDAFRLLQAGVPKFVVLSAGSILLAIGIYLTIRLVHRIGIMPQDTFLQRVALFGSGILPYFFLSLIYSSLYAKEDVPTDLSAIVMVFCFVVLIAWVSSKSLKRAGLSAKIEWKHAIFAAGLGLSAIAIPYLFFAR
jgi:hypothetical protein